MIRSWIPLPFIACAAVCTLAAPSPVEPSLSLAQRYWLYMNEGREVGEFESIGLEVVHGHATGEPARALERKRTELLDRISASALQPEVMGRTLPHEPRSGTDWPSLGGNSQHTGHSPDAGPVTGKEFWRFPVGYDYRATPMLFGDTVYVASPGTEAILYGFARKTGALQVELKEPDGRQRSGLKPGGALLLHDGTNASCCALNYRGEVAALFLVNLHDHSAIKRQTAQPSENRWQQPVEQYEPRRAYVTDEGRSVLVKGLVSGRVWWKFPAGPGATEPLQTEDLIFVGNDDGVLRALRMDGPLRVAWQFKIGAPWRAAPFVTNGVLYAGANNGTVYAFDAWRGTLLWTNQISTPNARAYQHFSPTSSDGGRVVIGAADGRLYCLDARSGRLRWKTDAGDWVRSRPFIAGDTIVAANLSGDVMAFRDESQRAVKRWATQVSRHELFGDVAGDSNSVFVTSSHLWLNALSLADGAVQWRQRALPGGGAPADPVLADAPPQIPQSPPTVANGIVYVGGPDRFVQAVDIKTGRRLWRFEPDGLIAAAPTVAGDKVLVGEYLGGGNFTAVDAKTGLPVWRRAIGGVWASPEYEDGRIYVGTTEGWMYALDAADGHTLWSWKTGDGIYPAPALDEQRVIFGSWDGHYYALDKRSGQLLWAWSHPGYPYHIGGRPDSPAAVIYEGKLIVPALGGRYVALDVRDGRTLWTWYAPPWFTANVTVAAHDGVAYLGVFGNTYEQPFGARLWALDINTGQPLWDIKGLGGLTSPALTGSGLMVCGSLNSPYVEAYQLKPDHTKPDLLWRLRTRGNMYESLPAISGNFGFFLSADGWLRAIY